MGSAQTLRQNLSHRKYRIHNNKSHPEEISLVNKNEKCKLGVFKDVLYKAKPDKIREAFSRVAYQR